MFMLLMIVVSPAFGTAIYLLLGANLYTNKTFCNLLATTRQSTRYYEKDEEILKEMGEKYPADYGSFHYLQDSGGFPFNRNENVSYYPVGDEGYPAMYKKLSAGNERITPEMKGNEIKRELEPSI